MATLRARNRPGLVQPSSPQSYRIDLEHTPSLSTSAAQPATPSLALDGCTAKAEAEAMAAEVEEQHQELLGLQKVASALEEQSAALRAEAAAERSRVTLMRQKAAAAEEGEAECNWEAEAVEAERRAVIRAALPAVHGADQAKERAAALAQESGEVEFHAQVLENRARALMRESEEMSELAAEKLAEADVVAGTMAVAVAALEELRAKSSDCSEGDLPQFMLQCQREIGILSHRLAQLREEVTWAEDEIVSRRNERELWDKLVVQRQSDLALQRLREACLREDAADASARSKEAAQEALMPAQYAALKYEEAMKLKAQAVDAAEVAASAHREALQAAHRALEVEVHRREILVDAAKAEAVARQAASQVAAGDAAVGVLEKEAQAKHEAAAAMHSALVDALETKEKLHALNPLYPMHTGASTALTQNQNGAAATEAA